MYRINKTSCHCRSLELWNRPPPSSSICWFVWTSQSAAARVIVSPCPPGDADETGYSWCGMMPRRVHLSSILRLNNGFPALALEFPKRRLVLKSVLAGRITESFLSLFFFFIIIFVFTDETKFIKDHLLPATYRRTRRHCGKLQKLITTSACIIHTPCPIRVPPRWRILITTRRYDSSSCLHYITYYILTCSYNTGRDIDALRPGYRTFFETIGKLKRFSSVVIVVSSWPVYTLELHYMRMTTTATWSVRSIKTSV